MVKKNNKDVVDIFSKLKKTLDVKPTMEKMYEEVRMMRFKIKPISGNIFLLKLKNRNLIETLWGLGKLDEVFQQEYKNVSSDQQEAFFRYFDNLYQHFQERLNNISASSELKTNLPQVLEMEIFKDKAARQRAN